MRCVCAAFGGYEGGYECGYGCNAIIICSYTPTLRLFFGRHNGRWLVSAHIFLRTALCLRSHHVGLKVSWLAPSETQPNSLLCFASSSAAAPYYCALARVWAKLAEYHERVRCGCALNERLLYCTCVGRKLQTQCFWYGHVTVPVRGGLNGPLEIIHFVDQGRLQLGLGHQREL